MDRVPRNWDIQQRKITTPFREFLQSDDMMDHDRSKADSHRLGLTKVLGNFILSDDDNSAGVVVEFISVTQFMKCLAREDFPELQYQAAWALANIAAGTSENTKVVVDHDTISIFVKLLSSPNTQVHEQAAWALGNIAADSPQYRDIILGKGALRPLVALMNEQMTNGPILKAGTWALSNFCRGKPYPPFDEIKPATSLITRMMYLAEEELIERGCSFLSSFLEGGVQRVNAIAISGVCPRIADLAIYQSEAVRVEALKSLRLIVDSNDEIIFSAPILSRLHTLLSHNYSWRDKLLACQILIKVTSLTKEHVQAVMKARIIEPLVKLLGSAPREIILLCLKCFKQVLEIEQNGFADEMEHVGGFDEMEKLCLVEGTEIRQAAEDILLTHGWVEEDIDEA